MMRRRLLGMEQGFPSSRWLRLNNPEAARIVADPKARRFLEPFLGQERSVGQVAEELEVDISSALYRVRQFLRLELIEQARLEPRRGRAIKHYRAVADGFYVPFSATSHATTETLSPDAFRNLHTLLNKSIAEAWTLAAGEPMALGIHIYRNENGKISRNITTPPDVDKPNHFFENLLELDGPAVWDTWGTRRLSREDAKKLQRELAEVFRCYPPDDREGNRTYMIRLAIAPLAEPD